MQCNALWYNTHIPVVDEAHKVSLFFRVHEQGLPQFHDVELAVVGPQAPLLRHAVLHHGLIDHLARPREREDEGGGYQNCWIISMAFNRCRLSSTDYRLIGKSVNQSVMASVIPTILYNLLYATRERMGEGRRGYQEPLHNKIISDVGIQYISLMWSDTYRIIDAMKCRRVTASYDTAVALVLYTYTLFVHYVCFMLYVCQ